MKGFNGFAALHGSQRNPEALRSRFASLLTLVGSSVSFVVNNVIVYPAKGKPVYEVVLDSPAGVEALVKEYFKFTRRKDPISRPPELNGVTIFHSVTSGTRVRISLLRVSPHSMSFILPHGASFNRNYRVLVHLMI